MSSKQEGKNTKPQAGAAKATAFQGANKITTLEVN